MGQQYTELSNKHVAFIEQQKMFFVGTATDSSKVNISPKGMDSFTVLDSKTVAWLNVTGSGNETAAHVQSHPRMTIMFTAFEGNPLILRLYGTAIAVHQNDEQWSTLCKLFPVLPGARQIFILRIDMVQTSCGMSVPLYDYVEDREQLNNWARQKGDEGIRAYWEQRNQTSLDGIETHILDKVHGEQPGDIGEPKLQAPSIELQGSYRAYIAELQNEERYPYPLDLPHDDFGSLISLLSDYAKGVNLPDWLVPNTTYWLVANGEIVACSHLRHNLNEALEQAGGHIGLGVRPSYRGKGLSKLLLKLTLAEANKKGIQQVHIHCFDDNKASIALIEGVGAKLQSTFVGEDGAKNVHRYVIMNEG